MIHPPSDCNWISIFPIIVVASVHTFNSRELRCTYVGPSLVFSESARPCHWVKTPSAVQSVSRRKASVRNAYVLAKFRFDTAENEPWKVCRIPRDGRARPVLSKLAALPLEEEAGPGTTQPPTDSARRHGDGAEPGLAQLASAAHGGGGSVKMKLKIKSKIK